MIRRALLLVALSVGLHLAPRGACGAQAEHVVVVVWDGMRPDFVSEEYTPTLHALAKRGTFFRDHHSSYVSSTEVNGAAIATGAYPGRNGIIANVQYKPELHWLSTLATEGFDTIRRGDLLTEGRYLNAPTLPEILQAAGIRTITAGAKPVVMLHDRAARRDGGAVDSVTLFRGRSLPRPVVAELESNPEVGASPKDPKTDSTRQRILEGFRKGRDKFLSWLNGKPLRTPVNRQFDSWTTRAVIHGLWKEAVPKYTLLWLSEPDASQHANSPGSPNARTGLRLSDRNLALVIEALKRKGILERTDIFVVSDHGFSSVEKAPDVVKALKQANFVAGKDFDNPEPGDILVSSLGGTIFFYVFDHHAPTVQRLVEFLQKSDYAGVIFSKVPAEGTFPLSQVRLDAGTNSPDVVVSMRWSTNRNDWGAPGSVLSSGGRRGSGTHASLSRFDLNNTLIAAGPDFKSGLVSEIPSGNIDVAPTILEILGVARPASMDGRVLREAMTSSSTNALPVVHTETFTASRDLGTNHWSQYLTISRVGETLYFDEGNGGKTPK